MYIPKEITEDQDYKRCVSFHGHTCMGVTIGYLAAKLGLNVLGELSAVDEELVAVVETDACPCDAIQVLTGCTFGKGNLFYLDYGKMAFTFASRNSGLGVRLVLKPGITAAPEKEKRLLRRIRSGDANAEDVKKYEEMYELRGVATFAKGPETFFTVETIDDFSLPPRAPMAPSKPCALCGEMVMETKLTQLGEDRVCGGCMQ